MCAICGSKLQRTCLSCAAELGADDRFCKGCGRRVETDPARPARQGERRQVTIMFCDLVGSAAIAGQLDAEDWAEVLHRYHATCRQVVTQLGGHVAQYLGDGVLVYFGFPRAFEDAARRAVRAALSIIDSVTALATQVRGGGIRLRARIGVDVGMVVLDEIGERGEPLALGDAPNVAARLQAEAAPGTVVISESVQRLVEGFFRLAPLGPMTLKGVAQPITAYRVDGETGVTGRLAAAEAFGLTPMVGHEEDLQRLSRSWQEVASGAARALFLTGEAGIGKSRHIRALKQHAAAAGATILEAFCAEQHQTTPLHPIADLLMRRLGALDQLSDEQRLARLQAELSREGDTTPDQLQAIGRLVAIGQPASAAPDPSAIRRWQATLAGLTRWIESFPSRGTALLVVEDLHWADPTTLDFVRQLLAAPKPGMLVVVTSRPEVPGAWSTPPGCESVVVGRLPIADRAAIVNFIASDKQLPEKILAELVARADGVPLYLEEMTKSILESGALVLEGDRYVLAGEVKTDIVPMTIQDSLAARFDRLGPTKRLLQRAAVLGREFSAEMLRAVENDDDLDAQVQRLVDSQLLTQEGDAAGKRYAFRHALIRDVAYQSLLRRAREQVHREIAQSLAAHFPELGANRPEFLAQHFAAGGLAAEAIDHWFRAGQRSISTAAFVEGIGHLKNAISLIERLPTSPSRFQTEIGLQASLGLALITTRGFAAEEVAETFSRAADLCDELGDTPFRVVYGIWAVQLVRSDADQCRRLVPHFLRVIDNPQSAPVARMAAHAAVASWGYWQGDYETAQRHAVEASRLCDLSNPRAQHDLLVQDYGVDCSLYGPVVLACAHLYLGKRTDAKKVIGEALATAEVIADPYVLATVMSFAAAIHYELGDLEAAQTLAQRVQAIAAEKEYLFWLASSSALLGRIAVIGKKPDIGFQALQQGLGILQQIGARTSSFFCRGQMIASLLESGRLAEASEEVKAALAASRAALDRQYDPELLRLDGEIDATMGDLVGARVKLTESLALARARGASLFEERTMASLARLERGGRSQPPAQPAITLAREPR